MKKTIKALLASAITAALGLILTLDAENMLNAVKSAVDSCLYTIIPSLFGFMAISSFLMRSGLYRFLFKPFYFIFRHIIRLSEEEFSVFFLSLFGGYPVGAKLIADECRKNPGCTLKRILPFCYCGSPVFIIAVTGLGIFNNTDAGLIIYLSNAAANVLSCAVYSFISERRYITKDKTVLRLTVSRESFTDSVMSAASSLFPVCAMVAVFGIISEAFAFCGVYSIAGHFNIDSGFFRGFLEISRLSEIKSCGIEFMPVISALTSFGGVCIIFQITAISGKVLSLKSFILSRVPIAVLSGSVCFLIMKFIKIPLETSSIYSAVVFTETGNPAASLALLIMSAFLLLSSGRKKPFVISLKRGL